MGLQRVRQDLMTEQQQQHTSPLPQLLIPILLLILEEMVAKQNNAQ